MSSSKRSTLCALFVAVSLTSLAFAQGGLAEVSVIGSGSGDGDRIPSLTSGLPVHGSDCTLSVSGAAPASLGFLVISADTGVSFDIQPGRTIYIDLPSAFIFTSFPTDEDGNWDMTVQLGSDPSLGDLQIMMQALVIPSLAHGDVFDQDSLPYQLTNGLGWRIGL